MAMTKFRTNELLDRISKQAALVAIQISNGSTTPALENLGGGSVSGMEFDSVSYTDGSDTFSLVITGVSDDIATQIQNQVGSNSIIRDIDLSGSTLTLTFNKDLSVGSGSSDDSGETIVCDPECNTTTQECVDGICIPKANPDNNRSCAKNSDCNTWCNANKTDSDYGCYCHVDGFELWNEDWSDCTYNNFSGYCRIISKTEKDQGYKEGLVWWAAKNFCSAIGSRMVGISNVSCSSSEPYHSNGCNTTVGQYWLRECWAGGGESCNNNSCHVLFVIGGSLYSERRDNSSAFALCE